MRKLKLFVFVGGGVQSLSRVQLFVTPGTAACQAFLSLTLSQSLLSLCYIVLCSIRLSPPDTFTTECHFCVGPATSFFLELLVIALHSFPVACWTPTNLGGHLLVSYISAFSYCSWGSHGKNTGVVCHSPLQWTMFCQNSSL